MIGKQTLLRSFLALGLVITVIDLLSFMRTPSEPKRAVFLGYSPARLSIALALVGIALVFLGFSIYIWRQSTSGKLITLIENTLDQQKIISPLLIMSLGGVTIGAIFLAISTIVIEGAYYYYLIQLKPFFWWITLMSTLTFMVLVLWRGNFPGISAWAMGGLIVILITGTVVHTRLWPLNDASTEDDIYFAYLEGQRLLNGENPYQRVLSGDMRVNQKYATSFPLFYLLAWGTQKIGLRDFPQWLAFWRVIFLAFNLLIASLLFYIPYRRNMTVLAIFAALFWLFNRWTLHVSLSFDVDFLPIFFLLLSFTLYTRSKLLSFLLLSLSLAIKQFAIFLVPLVLIWSWREDESDLTKRIAIPTAAIASLPLITSLPFIVWNWEGFFRSILFSVTRNPQTTFRAFSLDVFLGWVGLPSKLPMLLVLSLIYALTWQGKTKAYTNGLLVMTTFLFFNSVLFDSYFIWVVPFIPLAAGEVFIGPSASLRSSS